VDYKRVNKTLKQSNRKLRADNRRLKESIEQVVLLHNICNQELQELKEKNDG
jgi:hypothetical protein